MRKDLGDFIFKVFLMVILTIISIQLADIKDRMPDIHITAVQGA